MMYARPRSERRLREGVRRCAWSVAWLLVFLSTWQAPIPWLHMHEASAAMGQAELAAHLNEYHANESVGCGDWHWHFALIRDIARGSGCPVGGGQDELDWRTSIVVPQQAASTFSSLQRVDRAMSHAVYDMPALLGMIQVGWNAEFVASCPRDAFVPHRLLLSLLCVALC